jgi:hypothetical protein
MSQNRLFRWSFDDDIPKQPPKLLEDDMLYCETGALLALNWLRTAHAVVEQAGVTDEDNLRKAVNNALDALLIHRLECED